MTLSFRACCVKNGQPAHMDTRQFMAGGGKGGGSAPSYPSIDQIKPILDYQSQLGLNTARANQTLNAVDSYGPGGSVKMEQVGPDKWRQVTTMDPASERLWRQQQQNASAAGNLAGQSAGMFAGMQPIQSRVQMTPMRVGGLNAGDTQKSYASGGPIQMQVQGAGQIMRDPGAAQRQLQSFNPGQQVQGQLNTNGVTGLSTDFSGDARRAGDAVYQQATSRLDPQINQQRAALENKLANQGIGVNSTAYQSAMGQFNRGANDAYNQANYSAIQAGDARQNQLYGQQLAARGQTFGEAQAQGDFANSAAGQQYQQNLGAAQFANQGRQQDYQNQLAYQNAINSAQGQQFGQNATSMQLANAAQQQATAQNAAAAQFANQALGQDQGRNLDIRQMNNAAIQQNNNNNLTAAQFANQGRTQGLNEFGQLYGYQMGLPMQGIQGYGGPAYQLQAPDALSAGNSMYQGALNQYNARQQANSGLFGGLLNLGVGAISGGLFGGANPLMTNPLGTIY